MAGALLAATSPACGTITNPSSTSGNRGDVGGAAEVAGRLAAGDSRPPDGAGRFPSRVLCHGSKLGARPRAD
jgi:hypothetical protein